MRTCSVPGCGDKHYGRGWCRNHWQRWDKYGDPLGYGSGKRPPDLTTEAEVFAWFMPGEPPAAGCWDWTGWKIAGAYGGFTLNGTTIRAHVASYRIHNGPIDGLHVLHDCDRPICVHPAHLHLGTHAENMAEAAARRRSPAGSRNAHAKLTEADVAWVRTADVTGQEAARRLGVSPATISQIRSGKIWCHVLPLEVV